MFLPRNHTFIDEKIKYYWKIIDQPAGNAFIGVLLVGIISQGWKLLRSYITIENGWKLLAYPKKIFTKNIKKIVNRNDEKLLKYLDLQKKISNQLTDLIITFNNTIIIHKNEQIDFEVLKRWEELTLEIKKYKGESFLNNAIKESKS